MDRKRVEIEFDGSILSIPAAKFADMEWDVVKPVGDTGNIAPESGNLCMDTDWRDAPVKYNLLAYIEGILKETKIELKQVPAFELIPYCNNARTHSDEQVSQLAASIKEFGFNNPILTDGDKGLIAGHGRLLAAKKLGIDTVPVIELSHLTDIQKKAYILADNKLAENAGAYICLDWRRNHEPIPHIKKHFKLSNVIVWDKFVHGLGSDYKYTYELINVCKKGKPEMDTHQGDMEYSDVWHIQRAMGKNKDHATAKPIEITERCLRHASKPNALVLDLFLGSGSTLIACEKTNRECYGMELDPCCCDVIITRWEDYTGKKAVLLNGN